MIAQKAGGADWLELVEHRIIAPLGLRHTSIPGANPFLPEPHAQVYLATAAVTADGHRAVTVSITTTSAPADLPALNKATNALIDHALCAGPSGRPSN